MQIENKWVLDVEDSLVINDIEKKGTIIRWEKIDTLSKKNKEDAEDNFNSMVSNLSKQLLGDNHMKARAPQSTTHTYVGTTWVKQRTSQEH